MYLIPSFFFFFEYYYTEFLSLRVLILWMEPVNCYTATSSILNPFGTARVSLFVPSLCASGCLHIRRIYFYYKAFFHVSGYVAVKTAESGGYKPTRSTKDSSVLLNTAM